MTAELQEQSIDKINRYEEITRVKGAGQLLRIPLADVLEQMAVDHLSGKGKGASEFPAIVRGIIDYKEAKIIYTREDLMRISSLFSTAELLAGVERLYGPESILTNTDPFRSAQDNQQRILSGGNIKDYEKKKILLLEVPMFWMPTVESLGENAWLNSLMRMPVPKLKNKREFMLGEVINITFTNMQSFAGPKFSGRPVEDSPVIDDRFINQVEKVTK
jgi:hypothetical protein